MLRRSCFLLVVCSLFLAIRGWGADPEWSIVHRIHIGGAGGWDYLAVEPGRDRLFVSHGQQVVVVDLKSRTITGSMKRPGCMGSPWRPSWGWVSSATAATTR